ncbi:hypothetical protein L195_g020683 [Trifolium pratense]|uniref:Uncharacterized protein n=1 Tax=Trifolium pratense TaxID=57577 RepID=A0A2K3N385_TRIPR|nr:hypothetical protein L195_g020683 [Trifolium pratense]
MDKLVRSRWKRMTMHCMDGSISSKWKGCTGCTVTAEGTVANTEFGKAYVSTRDSIAALAKRAPVGALESIWGSFCWPEHHGFKENTLSLKVKLLPCLKL